jgi:hypothetical protein
MAISKRPILCMKGNLMIEFSSIVEAAEEFGLTEKIVYHCCRNGRINKASGCWFAFADFNDFVDED